MINEIITFHYRAEGTEWSATGHVKNGTWDDFEKFQRIFEAFEANHV